MSESTIARLNVLIGADLSALNRKLSQADKDLRKFGGRLNDIGQTLTVGLTAPLIGLGGVAVSAAANMDSLMRGLTAVAGSAEEAEKQFVRLEEIAKLPGLGLEEAIQGSINLQAAGFSAEMAESSLMAFGNALATVGKGKAELDGVITALTQIASKGTISAEEINQIAERVPQIRQVMQDAFGTSNTEALQDMGIAAEDFVAKIVAELGKLPPVTGGAQTLFENASDSLKKMAVAFGDILLPVILPVAAKLAEVAEWLAALDPQMQQTIVVVAGFAAALGPLLIAVGSIIRFLPILKLGFAALTGPIGLTIAAITALATAWLIWGDDVKRIVSETITAVRTWLVDRFNAIVDSVKAKVDAVTGFFKGMYDAVVGHSWVPDMVDGIAEHFARLRTEMVLPAERAAEMVSGAFQDLGFRATDALADFATGSKNAIRSFVESAIRDLARLALRMAAMRILGAALAPATGGVSLLGAGALSGFAASGANVRAGQSWVVGENGPEIFQPGVSGQVRPIESSGADTGALAAALQNRPRPMTPREAAQDDWWVSFISEVLPIAQSRGLRTA